MTGKKQLVYYLVHIVYSEKTTHARARLMDCERDLNMD